MTRLEALQSGRLGDPVPMTSLPFAQTIDLSDAGSDPDEPSPCLPTARSVWYAHGVVSRQRFANRGLVNGRGGW